MTFLAALALHGTPAAAQYVVLRGGPATVLPLAGGPVCEVAGCAPPGARVGVPVTVDMSGATGVNLRALATNLTWGAYKLRFDSVKAGAFGTLTPATGDAPIGVLGLSSALASGTQTTTQVLATAWFTATGVSHGTSIVMAPTSAMSLEATSQLARLRADRLDVCIGTTGKWGDVTGDRSVDIVDAQQIARRSVGLPVNDATLTTNQGDVNGDNLVNIIDAQQVARFTISLSAPARVALPVYTQPAIASITLEQATLSLAAGTIAQLGATPMNDAGTPFNGCVPVTWTTDNAAAVTVDAAGRVRAVAVGSAKITATSGGKSVQATVTVTAALPAQLMIAQQPSATVQNTTNFARQPRVQVADALGQPVRQAGIRVTVSFQNPPCTRLCEGSLQTPKERIIAHRNSPLPVIAQAASTAVPSPLRARPRRSIPMPRLAAGVRMQVPALRAPPVPAAPFALRASAPARIPRVESRRSARLMALTFPETSGPLTGTLSVLTNAEGVADFTDLGVVATAAPHLLSFSADGLPSASSSEFLVTAGPAYGFVAWSPVSFQGTRGQPVPADDIPSIYVHDVSYNAVKDARVDFTLPEGNGTIDSLTARTGVNGRASVGKWVLPDRVGSFSLTGVAYGADDRPLGVAETFVAAAVEPFADHFDVLSGADQDGEPGFDLQPVVARLMNTAGQPMVGATVVWGRTTSGCDFANGDNTTGVTDDQGRISITMRAMQEGSCDAIIAYEGGPYVTTHVYMAVPPHVTTKRWLGGSAGHEYEWNYAANWRPAGVPTPSDNVFVANAPYWPELATDVSIGDFWTDWFDLTFNSHQMTLSGNYYNSYSNYDADRIVMTGTGKLFSADYVDVLTTTGTIALARAANLGALSIAGGTFDVDSYTALVYNDAATSGTGRLKMTQAPSTLWVLGNMTFGGGDETSLLINGVMYVQGAFAQTTNANSFMASGNHILQMTGPSITLAHPASAFFGTLDIYYPGTFTMNVARVTSTLHLNGGEGTLHVVSPQAIAVSNGLIIDANADASAVSEIRYSGTTLPITPGIGPASLRLVNTVSLNGSAWNYTGPRVVVDTSGALVIGTGTATLSGKLLVRNTGELRMTGAGTLDVADSVIFAGAALTGKLTAGTLKVRGNFLQQNTVSAASFDPGGTFTTLFISSAAQSARFSTPAAASPGSHFQALAVANSSAFTLDLTGPATVGASSLVVFAASKLVIPATITLGVSPGAITLQSGAVVQVDGALTAGAGGCTLGGGSITGTGTKPTCQ